MNKTPAVVAIVAAVLVLFAVPADATLLTGSSGDSQLGPWPSPDPFERPVALGPWPSPDPFERPVALGPWPSPDPFERPVALGPWPSPDPFERP